MIAGGCGRLGKYLGIETRLLRCTFILTAEVSLPVYVMLWILVPDGPVAGQ